MKLPGDLTSLVRQLDSAWAAAWTAGIGTVAGIELGAPRGDGTRPKLAVERPCTSVALRLHHRDGQRVVAVWVSTSLTKKGAPSWSMDQAWRGAHPDEYGPVPLDATALAAYLAPHVSRETSTIGEAA